MVSKKVNKELSLIFDYGQSLAMNYLLGMLNIPYSLTIYNTLTTTPINILINLIALKYGISPLVVSMIITFIL